MGQQVAHGDAALAEALEAGHPGRHRSVRRTVPCSTSCITAVVVATTLVSEARSKTVSSDIGSASGATARLAERLFVDHGVAAAHHHDRPGQLPGGDGLLDDLVDAGEPGRSIQAGRAGAAAPAGRWLRPDRGRTASKRNRGPRRQHAHGASGGWP